MGTSGAYGGSGHRPWNDLQENAADWLDSLPDSDGVPAADVSPESGELVPESETPDADGQIDEEVIDFLRPISRALKWGASFSSAPTSSPIGPPLTGRMGGGRSPGGGGRSRLRAATVGARLATGIAALRAGDTEAAAELGLDLSQLEALGDPYLQSQLLLESAVEGVPGSLEDDELRMAAIRTAIWALEDGAGGQDAVEILRYFVAEYVYEIVLTEIGAVLRSGSRDGADAVAAEDRIHSTIVALAKNVPIDVELSGQADLREIAERILIEVHNIHGGSR